MNVELHPSQYSMLTCKEKIAFFVGGIGCGKSFTLGHFALNMMQNYPKTDGLLVANTYTQLTNATIPALTNILDDLGVEYDLVMGGAKKHITIGDTKVFIYSLEKPNNIRGIEVGWVAGDEVAYSTAEAIKVVEGRKRCKNGPSYSRYFTSPNGFNWLYDMVNKGITTFTMKTVENKRNLREGYYEDQVELYGGETTPMARQELFGEFVNQTQGSVYYAFKRAIHVKPVKQNPNMPVYVACDFNAGNMNYVAFQYIGGIFYVIDSTTLKDYYANTFSMAQDIYKKYGHRALVIPDSTAKSRKTSADAGITDIKILQNAGLTVLDFLNPRIKDRHNTVNARFFKDKIAIDPSCKDLIRDLETLSVDVEEGSHSHLAVCLGYGVWKLEPFTPKQNPTNVINPFLNKGNK